MTSDQGGKSDLQHWTLRRKKTKKFKSKRYHQDSQNNRRDQGPKYQLKQDKTYRKQGEDSVELRNSKSFIVSLIDNAVSRELSSTNTTQDSKTADGYEEFVHLDVGDAIDIVKSESSHKLNTQLCMDITRALTDKLINTTSKNNFLRAPDKC
uniref:Uncharacterized protein n=1 Tax=Timema poppense TaxID=170557 RepID=A0A7R9HDX0_TIMPO|nr:unnamed protein product [Timema poppensis]